MLSFPCPSGSTKTASVPRHDPARAPDAIRRYRYEALRQIGWPLFLVAYYVEWCGHGQELICAFPLTLIGRHGTEPSSSGHSEELQNVRGG